MIEAAIFDVDGTLIDSVELHTDAWEQAFADFGYHFPRARIRHGIGKGGDQFLPDFLTPEQLAQDQERLQKHREELGTQEYLPRAKAFPRVRELLERLKANGTRIVLGSSASPGEFAVHKRILQIDDLLDDATKSDDAAQSKPEPDIFLAALRKLGPVPPDRVFVIGDSPWDMLAAKKAGLRAIAFLSGGFPEDELRDAGAIAVYRNPADLLELFDASPLAAV